MLDSIMQAIIQGGTEGGIVMVVGMGIVFLFLTILVFAIMIMARIVAFINKICPPPVEEKQVKKVTKKADDTEIAIAVAIAASQG